MLVTGSALESTLSEYGVEVLLLGRFLFFGAGRAAKYLAHSSEVVRCFGLVEPELVPRG